MTIWQENEWKEKRLEIINEESVCAWCGSKEKLSIHHPPGTKIDEREYGIKQKIKIEFNTATKKERPDLSTNGKRIAMRAY